jgi:N-acetyl-anhydromuramyl-L-alanine amidase AmpD
MTVIVPALYGESPETPMTYRWIVTWMCLMGLAGCGVNYHEPEPPRIVSVESISQVALDPTPAPSAVETQPVPPDWIPPKDIERRWTAIVLHHSGTSNGNVEIFDRWHREKQWDGVGYDFVIGNGQDSGDGLVEVTFRWRQQRVGAHCKTPTNWANEEAIGICLVGNFEETSPTDLQMESLARLVRFLKGRYDVSRFRIYRHQDTPGANETQCPGSLFPMEKFEAMLDETPHVSILGQ